MRKQLAILFTVAMALGTTGATTAFAMTGHNNGDVPDESLAEGIPKFPGGKVVTSIDDIDLNKCNIIHNINACTPDEIKGLMGVASVITSVEVSDKIEPVVVGILVSGAGNPEPLFVDGEPVRPTPVAQPGCGDDEAGATVYVTAQGQTGYVVTHGGSGGVQGLSIERPPTIDPQVLPVAE